MIYKNFMLKLSLGKNCFCLFLFLFIVSGNIIAQTITGTVTDENNEPLFGASVVVKGTTNGTITNSRDGEFELNNVAEGSTLVISFIGFVTQEVSADSNNLSIILQEGNQLDEVVITAVKKETTLQKTAAAITAVSGLKLAEESTVTADQALRNVPNVVVQGAARGFAIAIRGLGSDLPPGVGESAVSTNFDGIYNFRAESGTLGFYDIDRIEVLRGPQGTLYGRNATGGVVNVESKNPSLNNFEGYATIDTGNYSLFRLEGAINAPLGEKFAARVSFANVDRDGYLSNGSNDAVATGVRTKFRFNPSEKVDVVVGAEFNKLGGKGPGFVPIALFSDPNNDDQLTTTLSPDVAQDYESLKLWANINFEAGPGIITLLPSYQRGEGEVTGERGGQLSTSFDPNPATQTSFEARYASKPESKVSWVFGTFIYNLENNLSGIPTPDARNIDKTNSIAGFGQVTIPFNDKLRGIAGVRYGSDKKSFETDAVDFATMTPLTTDVEDTWTAFDWKVGLEADLDEDVLGYLTLASGHRPGGFNSFQAAAPPRFESESLVSAELGLKSRFIDNKFQLNTSIFYYDYKDFQVPDFFIPAGSPFPVLEISNRDVRNFGFEIETLALLSKTTILELAATYLNSEYTSDFILTGALPPPPPPGSTNPPAAPETRQMNGETLPHAPQWSFNANLEQAISLGKLGRITPSIRYRWIDDQFVAPFPGNDQLQEAYGMIDVNIRFVSKNRIWSINAYGRNLTDEITKVAFFASDAIVGSPRQVGISLTARF